MSNIPSIVSVDWLIKYFDDPYIVVLDASYHLPNSKRDADQEFVKQHIPGALRFSIDEIADHSTKLPHMLPSPEIFDDAMQDLGIGAGMRVILYDSVGLFSAARAWWMFRHFGHDQVAVLDGGLPAWVAAGGDLQSGRSRVKPPPYPLKSSIASSDVVNADDLTQNLNSKRALVLDARSADRFAGDAPEPRSGMRSGHIPGSINIPFAQLLNSDTGLMKTSDQLNEIFRTAGIKNEPLVVTCGSGVTACILALALETAGYQVPKLYDGSWSEWGSRDDLPFETGST